MRRTILCALVVVGLFSGASVVAQQLDFQDPPPEQYLGRPGEEPKPQSAPVQKTQPAKQAPVQKQQVPVQNNDSDSFYLKPTYVTQEAFNTFKRGVVAVLKDGQKKVDGLSQQVLDFKIQLQSIPPQIKGMKGMLMQISTLVAAQAKVQQQGGANVWHRWWFWVLTGWSLVLTVLVACLFLKRKGASKTAVVADNGGDYDYLSQKDSLPSHLDLAQTYMTMGDMGRARKSLEFVVMNDKGALKDKAMQLLKQLPKDK